MDALSTATAFATIVSLLGTFKAERRESKDDPAREFLEFLSAQEHQDMRELLEANHATTVSIKALLSQNTEDVLKKLDHLDHRLASFASGVDELDAIAQAVHPDALLSEQSLHILRQLEEVEAESFIVSKAMGRDPELMILGDARGRLEYSETRFLEDDLRTMEELGLLRGGVTSKGSDKYIVTRAASEFAKALQVDGS